MSTRGIGEITVTRIEEMLRPGMEPAAMFPAWRPEMLEDNRHWMVPNCYDESLGRFISSLHSWVVRTRHHTIVVDTCAGNHKPRPAFERFHMLNTPWLDRLAAAGVAPEQVDFVMCTHLHIDHVGWNTRLVDGRWVPTFPNAKYVFSRIDRDYWDPAKGDAAKQPVNAGVFEDSVAPILEAGLDMIVDGAGQIGDGLLIEPTPGHTPGHVVLKVQSGNEEGVFTGDLMHHPIQVFHPRMSSIFCEDPVQSADSRERVLEYCADRNCRIFPAHFGAPHAGRVLRRGAGLAFEFDTP